MKNTVCLNTLYDDMVNMVIVRGIITNEKVIRLPKEWEDMIDPESITVSLTPIGAHQDVIVKRTALDEVVLQSKPGIPINCYYHIFGEIKANYELPAQ